MTVKITSFEAENVKRVKAVVMEPAESGLTVIGGRNGQGKTSVLDAIAWTLGGDRKRPSEAKREGSSTDPHLKVILSNGIVVERKGKNGSLKVTDPAGKKGGQMLLDTFVEQLALDLPKFLSKSDKEKADELLRIIGVGDRLIELEQREQIFYNQRTAIGQMRDQKRGAANDLPVYPDAPAEPISAVELIQRQQEILAKNGDNQSKRDKVAYLESMGREYALQIGRIEEQIADLGRRCYELKEKQNAVENDLEVARKTAEQLHDESTAEIEASLADIEDVNAKVRDNARHLEALKEAEELDDQYRDMTTQIEALRAEKRDLLDGADLPLPGLAVENGNLVYQGRKWDCMSGSEQLTVATAVVRRLKPECGFVLVDKLEQMDVDTMRQFGEWAESEGLQVIATRVSTGDECSIVIEDGRGGGIISASDPLINCGHQTAPGTAVLEASTIEDAAPKWVM